MQFHVRLKFNYACSTEPTQKNDEPMMDFRSVDLETLVDLETPIDDDRKKNDLGIATDGFIGEEDANIELIDAGQNINLDLVKLMLQPRICRLNARCCRTSPVFIQC